MSAPDELVGVVETTIFTRQIEDLLTKEQVADLHWSLAMDPKQGSVIRGSGGLRKLRWNLPGQGKRGGLRIIHYWITEGRRVYLLFAYRKNEQSDLTPDQVKELRKLIEEEAH